MHAPSSRADGAAVTGRIAPYRDRPPACDGYPGYNKYATGQQYRARILREPGAPARARKEGIPEAGLTTRLLGAVMPGPGGAIRTEAP